MTFRSRLLLFGYPLLEVATAYAVAMWLGWGWMLLLLLVGFPIGFAIMRNAGDAAMVDLQRAAQTGQEPDAGKHGLTFLGGLLIMIPGLLDRPRGAAARAAAHPAAAPGTFADLAVVPGDDGPHAGGALPRRRRHPGRGHQDGHRQGRPARRTRRAAAGADLALRRTSAGSRAARRAGCAAGRVAPREEPRGRRWCAARGACPSDCAGASSGFASGAATSGRTAVRPQRQFHSNGISSASTEKGTTERCPSGHS